MAMLNLPNIFRRKQTHTLSWGALLLIAWMVLVLPLRVLALSETDRTYLNTPFYDPDSVAAVCSGPGLSGTDNEERAWNFFVGKGLKPEQAAGVMGNLKVESGFIPDNQENSKTWPSGGWGIAQWTGGRRLDLRDAVIAAGLPYTEEQTPANQIDALLAFELDYLYRESNGRKMRDDPSTGEWEGLTKTTTVKEAAEYWQWNFERPLSLHSDDRVAAGQTVYDAHANNGTAGVVVTDDCTSGGTDQASPDVDTSAMDCPAGTTDAGVEQDYGPGRVETVKLRLCNLPTINRVNASIAAAALAMMTAMEEAGLRASGSAWRSFDGQLNLRRSNGCPDIYRSRPSQCRVPTAIPGTGMHEVGLAIDFSNMCFPRSTCPSNEAWRWLMENAGTFGFKKLSSEAWHWSINGR